ncbi:MAG: DUF368 domain-containing protein [Oscillospiraceae bacterium]|nr:DUF368 domain-containing protein [Oscillospiraceae bacterium]
MEYILNIVKGVFIGVANAIPGVSGGTMMVIMKVFDRLMDILGNISFKKIKDNFFFLLTIGIGMAVGVLASATVLDYCFEEFYVQTQFFFMGVVAGSLPAIYKEATSDGKFRPVHIVPFIAGFAVMIAVTLISMQGGSDDVITELTLPVFIYLFLCLAVAAAAMIMPGLSGSLVLLILGGYRSVIEAVSLDNIAERFPILIPAALGAVFGIIGCAKAVTVALKKSKLGTYAVIMGLIIGSFFAIFPRETAEGGEDLEWGITAVYGIIALVAGAAIPLLFDRFGSGNAKKES